MAGSALVPAREVLMPAGPSSILPGAANVTPELEEAGKSFGNLLLVTGNAVAESQRRLNQASAKNAMALSTTKVEVIAVRETTYGDDGTIEDSTEIVQKLPLVNFMDPVFYEWPDVHLQGVFMADEITSGQQSASQVKTASGVDTGARLGIKFGPLSLAGYERRAGTSSAVQGTTMTAQATTSDYACGNIRLNARLVPKTDVGVPKPRQIVRGPKLNFVHLDPDDNPKPPALPQTRTVDVTIRYTQHDGSTPIGGPDEATGKLVSIESDGLTWKYLDNANKGNGDIHRTDKAGEVKIQLIRTFVDNTDDPENPILADRSPIDVMVTARVGMVRNTTVVRF